MPGSPVLVRYADDYVAMCYSREQAEEVKARLTAWLAPRGLSLNEDKTKVVHAEAGFNFLGFNVRRYVGRQGGKLLIKPSQESVKRLRDRLAAEVRSLHGSNAAAVVNRLNPIIRGWSAYYRSVVSSRLFAGLDHYVWHLTYRWARRMHPNKSKSWVVARYFGKFNMARQDRWVFGDRETGSYLTKFSWAKIVRHVPVRGRASPDDPSLAEYWADRRCRHKPLPLGRLSLGLYMAQGGLCPRCGSHLLLTEEEPRSPQQWEECFIDARRALRNERVAPGAASQPGGRSSYRLVHASCWRCQSSPPGAKRLTSAKPS